MKLNRLSVGVLFLLGTAPLFFSQEQITKEKNIEEVTITNKNSKEHESNVISVQKKSVEVIERVGATQLKKQGVGDVSVAVTKATGSQKQEGSGQIFIRGLGDRNNSTSVNGLPIPANDPLYKNIDLSIIKTDMIDFIDLEKVYHPKMWGDMSGANVDIATKVYLGKPYLNVNLGSSISKNAIDKKHFYLQNGPSYFGFTTIKQPTHSDTFTKGYAFNTSTKNKEVFTPINSNFGLDFGRTFKMKNNSKLSIFGFASFDSDYGYYNGVFRNVDAIGTNIKNLNADLYSRNTNTTGLLNLNYRFNREHSIDFTSNYIHTTEQKLGEYQGFLRDIIQNPNENTAFLRRGSNKSNDLFINQLLGKHTISEPLSLDWAIGYNRLDSERPDRQQNLVIYNKINDTYKYRNDAGTNHRYFDELIEDDFVGNVNLKYDFNNNTKLSLGYNGRYKKSDFSAVQYNFKYFNADNVNTYFIDPNNLGSEFNQNNYLAGLFDVVTFRGSIKYNPNALDPQTYNSEVTNNAAYINLDHKFNDKLTAQLGIRYDNLMQDITYDTSINTGSVKKDYSKILPALNIKYTINRKNNLRLSASKTYTNPLLIEIAPFEYEDVDQLSRGNKDLYPADNYNLDLKWEWFMKRNELFSITAFGKYIKNPISRITINSSATTLSYANVGDTGSVYGIEMELRKDIAEFGNSRIYTFLNASYLKTEQKLDNEKVSSENEIFSNFNTTKDRMQGASDFLANVNLGWEYKMNKNSSMDLVLAYSHISDNLYALGYQMRGDLIDKAINTLDAVYKVKFKNGIGISLSGKNLLNPNFKRVQNNTNGEQIVRDYKKGISLEAGVSYKF